MPSCGSAARCRRPRRPFVDRAYPPPAASSPPLGHVNSHWHPRFSSCGGLRLAGTENVYRSAGSRDPHTLLSAIARRAGGATPGGRARAARPGEFTLRAFLAGKLDLTRAEAVLGVIEANDQDELRAALAQFAGGVGRPMQALRDDLLNLLADVEAALDFADEDISFVGQTETLTTPRRRPGSADAAEAAAGPACGQRSAVPCCACGPAERRQEQPLQRPDRRHGASSARSRARRAITLSDVWTSVTGRHGTGGHRRVANTARYDRSGPDTRPRATERADLVLLCVEAGTVPTPEETAMLRQTEPAVFGVATKCDLFPDRLRGWLPVPRAA